MSKSKCRNAERKDSDPTVLDGATCPDSVKLKVLLLFAAGLDIDMLATEYQHWDRKQRPHRRAARKAQQQYIHDQKSKLGKKYKFEGDLIRIGRAITRHQAKCFIQEIVYEKTMADRRRKESAT